MINLDQKEFTYLEYQDFIEKHNLESFSKSQVDAFSRDVLEKSKKQEVDEYEISCAAADYASLHPVTVVREDLTKCIMYWREAQTEGINIPNGIFKSIDDRACRKFKETDLNIFKGIAGINCADKDAIEKAKALPLGTEKTYGGKLYVKTERGWRLKKKGTSSGKKEVEESKSSKDEKQSFVSKSELDNSGDGSVINVKYAQTGNIAISFTKKEGKWFSKNTMTRGDVQVSPEQVVKTLEKYNNKKVYNTKADLKDIKTQSKENPSIGNDGDNKGSTKESTGEEKKSDIPQKLSHEDVKVGMIVQRNDSKNGSKFEVVGKDDRWIRLKNIERGYVDRIKIGGWADIYLPINNKYESLK